MLIRHFNRAPRPGNHTFEQLFGCIRRELEKQANVISYDLPSGLNPLQAIRWAQRRAGDINHITGDVNYLAYGLPAKRTLITVHDLGHYSRTLKGLKKWVYRKFWLDGPLKRVQRLTAVSEFTKRQLVEVLNIPEQKITVIPDPVLPGIAFSPKEKLSPKPVILQIGSGRNKNLRGLIEATRGMNVKLLLVNKLYDPDLKRQLIESGIEYEQRVDLSFDALKQAYCDSDLLFFASEYEGFGMPIVEAQATGRPVITSKDAAMPDTAGVGGALFVDPYKSDEIRKCVEELFHSPEIRLRLISKGLENAAKYDVRQIAQQYLNLYHSL